MTVVFLVTAGGVLYGSGLLPVRYQADASLLVRLGREFAFRPGVGSDSSGMLDLEEIVNSEVEILSSRELAGEVVEEIGPHLIAPELDPLLAPRATLDTAIAVFRDQLNVRAVEQSSIVQLRYQHGDAGVAARALNILLERFESKHLEIFRDPRSDFVGEQLAGFRVSLEEAEGALEAYKHESSVFDLPEQRRLLLTQRSELETLRRIEQARWAQLAEALELFGVEEGSQPVLPLGPDAFAARRSEILAMRGGLSGSLRETDFRLTQLEFELPQAQTSASGDPAAAVLSADSPASLQDAHLRLLELQLQERELLENFGTESRSVQSVRERIDLVERFLHEQTIGTRERDREALGRQRDTLLASIEGVDGELQDLARQEVLAEARTLRGRVDSFAGQIAGIGEELTRLDGREQGLRRLERAVVLYQGRFDAYTQKHDEARITEELDSQRRINVRVIERATEPTQPLAISTKLRAVLSAGAGLFAAAALGILRGMSDAAVPG